IEILDAQGNVVDTVAANSRRGLSRVEWSMRRKAPRVPPAATAAFEAANGPRVLPGTYTVKMARGKDVYTTPLVIGLDRRAKYNLEDRRQQYAATMRVYHLLGDMTFDVDRINGVKDGLQERMAKVSEKDALRKQLEAAAAKTEEMRRKIVATTEGGAITGEIRIREKTTDLYGELVDYEGRPTDYQLARIDALQQELDAVVKDFDAFVAKDLAQANTLLKKKKLAPIEPLTRAEWDKSGGGAGAGPAGQANIVKLHERD